MEKGKNQQFNKRKEPSNKKTFNEEKDQKTSSNGLANKKQKINGNGTIATPNGNNKKPVQNQGNKKDVAMKDAESSSSDSSSSEEEEVKTTKPVAKQVLSKKKESSDEESSSSEEEEKKSATIKKKVAEIKKPVTSKNESSDDSSSEEEEIKTPTTNGKNTKSVAKTVEKESSDEDSSSSEEEEVKKTTTNGKSAQVVTKVETKPVATKATPSKPIQAKVTPSKPVVSQSGGNQTDVEFRKKHNITLDVPSKKDYSPIQSFASAKSFFTEQMLACTKGFEKPTPIQAQCWPVVLDNKDIIAIAETGSGKTLAFALPALVHLSNAKPSKNPKVLVLSPTRELAQQTAKICEDSGAALNVSTLCVFGGVPKFSQTTALKKGVSLLIATPGRLQDLWGEYAVALNEVDFLVLDEADRMLDMGFEKPIREIISQCSQVRQTLMFSATWPSSIQTLAREFLKKDAVKVTIGSLDLSANHRVMQTVEVLEPFGKDKRLVELLNLYHKSRKNRIIVFALYKLEASRVETMLRSKGFNVIGIHGDKSQDVRNRAIGDFKSGKIPLLVATDVAARGLDIPDVEYVINYTFPLTIEDYVHRIGRTGRAGKSGHSHTFFTIHDKSHAGELVNVLREASQVVPEELTKFGIHVKKKEHALYGSHYKNIDESAPAQSTHVKFD